MLETLLLTSFLLCGTQAEQGFDMNDDDFASYVQTHENFREKYGESFGKGCINGAIGGSPAGVTTLCVGCVMGGAASVVQDLAYPPQREKSYEREDRDIARDLLFPPK